MVIVVIRTQVRADMSGTTGAAKLRGNATCRR
jgi:hypothetical protein